MKSGKILVGWSSADVTPKGKVSLRGQFHLRLTEEVHDPLTATVLALESEDASASAIIVSLDAVGISDHVLEGCRKQIGRALPGFDLDNLFISATHTHTAPDQPGANLSTRPQLGDDVMSEKAYGDFLVDRISEAAIEAWNGRRPGALAWGRGHAVVGFNRRVSYFDGSSAMYGKTKCPEFSHIEGYEDHGVDMLFTYDDGRRLTGMVLNVPCPSQCTENAYYVSADYWHETRATIRSRHGKSLFILPQCSAAGDQSPRTMVNRKADARMLALKGFGDNYDVARRQDIADKIAAAVDDVLPLAAKDMQDKLVFGHRTDRVALTRRKASPDDLETARREVTVWTEKLESLKGCDPASKEYSQAYRRLHFNKRVIDLYEAQQRGEELTFPVELHTLRIGDVAMCTNRFEYFLDFGLRIKERSPALQTFVVQLAGQGTYLPTERAMKGGSYGAYIASTPIGPEGGQEIVERQVCVLEEMFSGE